MCGETLRQKNKKRKNKKIKKIARHFKLIPFLGLMLTWEEYLVVVWVLAVLRALSQPKLWNLHIKIARHFKLIPFLGLMLTWEEYLEVVWVLAVLRALFQPKLWKPAYKVVPIFVDMITLWTYGLIFLFQTCVCFYILITTIFIFQISIENWSMVVPAWGLPDGRGWWMFIILFMDQSFLIW